MSMAAVSLVGSSTAERAGLVERVLKGEVFLARGELQNFGLMDMLVDASLAGIARASGSDVADRVRKAGFQRIHEIVSAPDILEITEAIYEEMTAVTPIFLQQYAAKAFPGAGSLYFEQTANVRFHIPYDLTADHRTKFQGFRGEGKVAAHGPHRDSWLNCPDNAINVWIAVGPVRPGNGLTIFQDDNWRDLSHNSSGDIADTEKLHKPVTFSLQAGDAIIFHSDLLHGSELNRTDETRFVISFRITFGKPHFPRSHSHEYIHAAWNSGFLKPFARWPAKAQVSYARSTLKRVKYANMPLLRRLVLNRAARQRAPDRPVNSAIARSRESILSLPAAEVPIGSVKPISEAMCVARLSETECVLFSRRCPHRGADLSNGWIENREIFCPWHNLNFDLTSGASPCSSLPRLKRFTCEIQDDRIVVDTRKTLA